jgi:uncharacterized protein
MERRTFVKLMAGSAIGSGMALPLFSNNLQGQRDKWGPLMPLKDFGRTGRKVTILGVGGFHVGRMSDYEAEKTIELAIEEGIRFFDAAESYVGGENEIKYGKFLTPKYRDEIFLLTKTKARDGSGATEHLNASLKRMKTDYVDLWLMHQVDSKEDFDVLRSRGMLDAFIRAKESGKVKHIGFSGHRAPEANLYVFEQTGLTMEANMLPVNVVDPSYGSFIKNVIPVLLEKKIGIIAMKTLAGGAFWGGGFEGGRGKQDKVMDQITVKDAIHFALSMPVDVLVTGAKDAEMLKEKIDLTKSFAQLSPKQQESLISKVSGFAGTEVEYYKA